jgi:phage I-like protein
MNIATLSLIMNRNADFAMPADGFIQLVPLGRVQAPLLSPDTGEEVPVVQVVDRPVVEALHAQFREQAQSPNFPGLLIDFDHFSDDTEKPSRAAGWVEETAVRDDGLWGRVRFSASGKAALEGGDYRLFSPVLGYPRRRYAAGEEVRPAVLLRGALTNDPRFKGMVPLSNRQGSPSATDQSNMEKYKAMLLALLGLPETATDAEIEAAQASSTANMQKGKAYDELKNRHDALLTAQIEADLDSAGLKGESREAAKGVLTLNREKGLTLLKTLTADAAAGRGAYAPVHNRAGASVPPAAAAHADRARKREAAVEEYRVQNRCSFDQAWQAVRAVKPELFAE